MLANGHRGCLACGVCLAKDVIRAADSALADGVHIEGPSALIVLICAAALSLRFRKWVCEQAVAQLSPTTARMNRS
jgi:hypothetical protein